jgi:hypothetical protein
VSRLSEHVIGSGEGIKVLEQTRQEHGGKSKLSRWIDALADRPGKPLGWPCCDQSTLEAAKEAGGKPCRWRR